VQGQLRNEYLQFTVESECGHCGQTLKLEIDSDLNYRIQEHDIQPLIYAPLIDVAKLDAPSIIDGF
jgi:hypothetical protein